MFSQYYSLSSLATLSHVLRLNLEVGMPIVEVFRQQSARGPAELKDLAVRLTRRLQRGKSLASSLRKEPGFPPLFLTLVEVGEESGHLAEVFASLEQYYTLQQQIKTRFRARIFMPIIQFIFALMIIAGVIFILGIFSAGRTDAPAGILGLSGASGALIFLGVVGGGVAFLVVGGQWAYHRLRGKYMWDTLLLRLPLIGSCAQAMALARFTLAMHLTLESGMLITRAVRLSLKATGNAAFESLADDIERELRHGSNLTLALTSTWVFPAEFRHILGVAEESGRVPEAMRHQSRHFQEEGERRFKGLMHATAWGVWGVYAAFMVLMILQLAGVYFRALPL